MHGQTDLERIREQAVAELVADARRAADRSAVTTPYRACVYCGAARNLRCCEFGRDR